jgi:predicted nuclease with TOPRIM domain
VPEALGYDRAMPRTRSTTKQNDILTRFTELGHEALNKLSDVPGGSKLVDMMNESKARLDEMQKKLRGLDALEKRVTKLEQQLAASAKKPVARKPAASKPKPATPKKPPA